MELIIFGAGAIGKRVARDILPNIAGKFSNIFYFDNNINKQDRWGNHFYAYRKM